MSDEAKDLITRLLNKSRKKRLGQKGDAEEVLAHPWFKDVDTDCAHWALGAASSSNPLVSATVELAPRPWRAPV